MEGRWSSYINWRIYFHSRFHPDILTLEATAEDPESDLTNRLTVTHSIVLNIAPENEPHKKASLTFLLDRNTKTATLDTCVVNKEASLPSRKGSAAEAGEQEGIASSQKANGEPKTLRYIPNDDLLQVLESLCSAVANEHKPTILKNQFFNEFRGTIVCIPYYHISIQSTPYPFFYRQLPVLFKLIQRHTGSFKEICVSRFQGGDPLNDEGKAYLITQMVDSLTNPKCPHISIKDGSFIAKGDDATLTPQEKDIYEGFGYLIGLLFNDDTQTDIQRTVVDQLFRPRLLSIDILRADPKSFAYHVARLCYAGEPLGRLPDYLLPPSKTSKVSPRGRTQSRSRRAYADEDGDGDELFAHLPHHVSREEPSPAASDYSGIPSLGPQQMEFHRAQQAAWLESTTLSSSIDNRMLSIKDKDLQTCIYNIIADAANRNHRTLSSSLEEAKQQWGLRLPRLLIDAFSGLDVFGNIDEHVDVMNVETKCWNVFTKYCYHYLQKSCKLQTPPLKAINQGIKVFTTSNQYDVERFFEKISTLNIGGQYVHEGGACAGGAQELFSSRSLSPTLHRENAASSSA